MAASELQLDITLAPPDFPLRVRQTLQLRGVTALFGPSGSGKTTLLRVLAGFVRGRGQLLFEGEVWQDSGRFLPPHKRPVGFLFQDGRLFRHLGVEGNLRYAARRASRKISFAEVVQALDLGSLLKRGVASLSGGETQRVALARTLLSGPRLMLLDEPLSALDAARKEEIFPYLERVVDEFDTPVIYVSHALDEVLRLAENVLVLAGGELQDYGQLQKIMPGLAAQSLPDPMDTGSILEARFIAEDSEYQLSRLQLGGQELLIPALPGSPGQLMRLQVRDRDVALALERSARISIRNQLACRLQKIDAVEGPWMLVTLDLEGQVLKARLTRAAVAQLKLAPGQAVFALVKAARLHG